MKGICFFFILLVFNTSCNNKKNSTVLNSNSARTALMEADKSFSDMSLAKGMKNAFVEFIDSNGVLLRPGKLPIVGANAIDYIIQQNDTGYSLTWQVQNAEVASSGELGYSYGIYELKLTTKDTVIYGTYTNIWKKQKDGKWKFVLQAGNEGVGEDTF